MGLTRTKIYLKLRLSSIFIAEEDGTNLVRLTNTSYDEAWPCWSLDRKKIVYATSDGELNMIDIETNVHYPLSIEADELEEKLGVKSFHIDKAFEYQEGRY